MTSDSVQRLRALALQKEEIEREIERLVSCLEVTPAGVRGPLVDEDGFPRSDCDVYQIRQYRQRLVCLQTDYRQIMREIERLLPEVLTSGPTHAQTARSTASVSRVVESAPAVRTASSREHRPGDNQPAQRSEWTGTSLGQSNLRPFAKVVQVEAGSPAAQGGLQEGDLVVRVASCTDWETLAVTVSEHRAQPVVFSIVRGLRTSEADCSITTHDIVVVPTPWAGAGLLGARFERY
jgi:26S proteasome non-ATPase regulatory subunit 9